MRELFPEQKPDQLPNLKADLIRTPPVLVSVAKRRTVPLAKLVSLYVRDAYKPDSDNVGLDHTRGSVVKWVLQEAVPQAAALKPGDVIVAVNGEAVPNDKQFDNLLRRMPRKWSWAEHIEMAWSNKTMPRPFAGWLHRFSWG